MFKFSRKTLSAFKLIMASASRRLLLLSSSRVHGKGYLEFAEDEIKTFLGDITKILFVPYALRDADGYAQKVRDAFKLWDVEVDSVHEAPNPVEAVSTAQAIFVGGGNTFQLLKSLYDNNIISAIRKRVLDDGIPYIGSSAGTNVATLSICTTNDMPIVYPPSFDALGLVPFNINPHYVDPDPSSTHMGETREERIKQYHEIPSTPPVLGLREGCILHVEGNKAMIKGVCSARLFRPGSEPEQLDIGADVSSLLTWCKC